jgi:hypothetical protein
VPLCSSDHYELQILRHPHRPAGLLASYSAGSGQPLPFPTVRTGAAPRPPCVRPPSVQSAGTDGRLPAPRPHPGCLGAPPKPSLSIFVLMRMYQINPHLRETIRTAKARNGHSFHTECNCCINLVSLFCTTVGPTLQVRKQSVLCEA